MVRPLRELKGFEKLKISAGETKTVEFTIGWKELGFYLENGEYTVEPGDFEIYVGGNCLTDNRIIIKVNK